MVSGMPEDPAVAAVEELFGSSRRYEADPRQRAEATFALWLCTCYSDDAAPTWLVCDRAVDGVIDWCRVPDRIEPLDLVNAQDTAGNHTSPADVLLWLQRSEADPWGGSGSSSDAIVLEALREKLLAK
jgi:hypothetical protein